MNQVVDDLCRRDGQVTAASLAQELGVSRQAAHRQIKAAVEAGDLVPVGQARARRYVLAVPRFEFPVAGCDEDQALSVVRERLAERWRGLADTEERALHYAFCEMVNNAIDHSKGSKVSVTLTIRDDAVELEVGDDGIGAFLSVQVGRALATPIEAAAEITKGKVTTMPSRHSGQGVFFTSKVADHFELEANGVVLVVDNVVDDCVIRAVPARRGTFVRMKFCRPLRRTLHAVFTAWSDDTDFAKTRTVVRLFGLGRDFVSRSEARRLLHGLESFREVVVDFQGVEGIGQAFADEVFRVFPSLHPNTHFVPVNMVEAVRFFVERAERARHDS